jgi:hypothetical protein
MPKPLQIVLIAILCVVGSLYWYAGRQQERYDAAATAYLRQALTAIGGWHSVALRRHLADEALSAASDAQLEAMVERYRPLGAFQDLQDVKFARLTAALSLFGSDTLLSYHGQARFANGSAQLTATLVVRDGSFRLYNFSLSSPQVNANAAQ